jgi:hypothetical protein
MAPLSNPMITIRHAYADDELALTRLAALDSAPAIPQQPMLLAEVDGELRAAVSLHDGTAIADPFFPTADLLDLLRVHGRAINGRSRRRARRPLARIGQLRTA